MAAPASSSLGGSLRCSSPSPRPGIPERLTRTLPAAPIASENRSGAGAGGSAAISSPAPDADARAGNSPGPRKDPPATNTTARGTAKRPTETRRGVDNMTDPPAPGPRPSQGPTPGRYDGNGRPPALWRRWTAPHEPPRDFGPTGSRTALTRSTHTQRDIALHQQQSAQWSRRARVPGRLDPPRSGGGEFHQAG